MGLKARIEVGDRFVDAVETCAFDELRIVAGPKKLAESWCIVACQ